MNGKTDICNRCGDGVAVSKEGFYELNNILKI